MQPLISIIIPTYQRRLRLKIALESILSQTFTNYEILIMDDGSNDGTKEMVDLFNDPRISYNWQSNSGKPAKVRNNGIKIAQGEWIAFLDSDDWWLPDKLKDCMYYCNDDVDLIYHDLKIVNNNKKIFKRKKIKTRRLKKPVLKDLLLNGNAISNSSVVVRRKLLIAIGYIDEREELVAAEDYHAWLKIAKLTDNFFYLPKCLGYYSEHEQNLSKKDMSIPSSNAVSQFRGNLNIQENLIVEANIKYKKGKFDFQKNNFSQSKKSLLFVLKYGDNSLKFMSILLLIMIFLKCALYFVKK